MLPACTQPSSDPPQGQRAPAPAPPSPSDVAEAAFGKASNAAKGLGQQLKAELQAAMASGGPKAALEVCADRAQAITASAQQAGVTVGRSSLRLRNPANRGPDWVRAWLEKTGERQASGLSPMRQLDSGHVRWLKPIAVEGVCVVCHGAPEQIHPDVQKLLAERYPEDRATGYSPGQLRGVVWAEVALPKTP